LPGGGNALDVSVLSLAITVAQTGLRRGSAHVAAPSRADLRADLNGEMERRRGAPGGGTGGAVRHRRRRRGRGAAEAGPRQSVSFGKDACGVTHYASTDYLCDEGRLFGAAGKLAAPPGIPPRSRRPPARPRPRADALRRPARAAYAATTGDVVILIVVGADAGKTTAAAIAGAYRGAGYDVLGAALAGKASDTLRHQACMHSRTFTTWECSWGCGEETLDRIKAHPNRRIRECEEGPYATPRWRTMLLPRACFPCASLYVNCFRPKALKTLILLEPTPGIEPGTC